MYKGALEKSQIWLTKLNKKMLTNIIFTPTIYAQIERENMKVKVYIPKKKKDLKYYMTYESSLHTVFSVYYIILIYTINREPN